MMFAAENMAEMREAFRLLGLESKMALLELAREFYRGQEEKAANRESEDSGLKPEEETGLNSHGEFK